MQVEYVHTPASRKEWMTTGRLCNPGTATHSYITSPLCHPSAGPFSCNRSVTRLHVHRLRSWDGNAAAAADIRHHRRTQTTSARGCSGGVSVRTQLQTGWFMRCMIDHLPLNSREDPLTLSRDTTHKHGWVPALPRGCFLTTEYSISSLSSVWLTWCGLLPHRCFGA